MDRYIDNAETQTYGARLAANIRRMFGEGAPVPVVGCMLWCAEQIDGATRTMETAMSAARKTASAQSATAEEKLPVVEKARGDLRAFHLHLGAKKADEEEPWNGDLDLFIPGGLSAVGAGARALRDAVKTALAALTSDTSVPERARWMKRLGAQVEALDPLVEQSDGANHARNSSLSEQSAEKRNWLRTYRGVALVLEGALMILGREKEYTAAVPHLSAPGARKRGDGEPNAPAKPARPSQAPPVA